MRFYEFGFWTLFFLGIVMVLWLFFGNTPTIEQALLILILGMVIKNSVDIKGIRKDLSFLRKQFNALAKDFKSFLNKSN
tara:strand:+ start:30297 stop:30533 length:237 start_codon:yes stop_codon:yes gene_type:complete